MSVFQINLLITDGEFEYGDIHYVYALDADAAVKRFIKNMGYNDQARFLTYEFCEDTALGCWQENRPGYRIHTIEGVGPAIIFALGFKYPIDIAELMSRPILPADSMAADWIWRKRGKSIFWWYQGDIVLQAEVLGINDISISVFSYFGIEKRKEDLISEKWLLAKNMDDNPT